MSEVTWNLPHKHQIDQRETEDILGSQWSKELEESVSLAALVAYLHDH